MIIKSLLALVRVTIASRLTNMRATADDASEITTLFLCPMDSVENLILSEVAIERCSTK